MPSLNRVFLVLAVTTVMGTPTSFGTAILDDVTTLIGAEEFYSRGYTGSGAIIAKVEAAHVWDGHQTLNDGRVAFQINYEPETTFTIEAHATQVGGVMVADGLLDDGSPSPTGSGIAPGATLWSGQIATSFGAGGSFSISGNSFLYPMMVFGELGLNAGGEVGGPGAVTADVMNSSWSAGDDTGNTIINAVYDYLANTQGVTMVAAAGNAGPGAGTVGAPAHSWNVIAVGATVGAGETESVTSFSSGGPTGSFNLPGTRTKPDIVAPGYSILMPTTGSSSSFAYSSGTSFASPIVAGVAGLVVDYGKDTGRSTDPRLIKAILLNSASKLDGFSQLTATHPQTGTIINYTPLDDAQGAGRVDAAAAFKLYQDTTGSGTGAGEVRLRGWDTNVVGESLWRDYVIDRVLAGGEELSATLIWFMDRSVEGFNPNRPDPFAKTDFTNDSFDDLDLLLYQADETGQPFGEAVAASISGWDPDYPLAAADGLDSVEHLSFELPSDGRYVLRVRWTQELIDFVGDANVEDFALAWSAPPIPGDINGDGRVHTGDLSVLAANWQLSGIIGYENGDMNGDERVSIGDLSILALNWDYTATSPVPVPEPGAAVMILVGLSPLLGRKRRPSRSKPST